jgi:hypothetical protein
MFEKKTYKKIFIFLGVFLLTPPLAYVGVIEYMKNTMNGFNCRIFSKKKYGEIIERINSEPVYQLMPGEKTINLNLNFNLLPIYQDHTFIIESTIPSKGRSNTIYRGPYKRKINLTVGENFFNNGAKPDFWGGDTLQFYFYINKQRTTCGAYQDGGDLIWKPNANVYIDFLPWREIDESVGRPISYKVRID